MAESLTFLVIDRAPLSGVEFQVLLYLAIAADERDVTHATGRSIGQAMRLRTTTGRAMLDRLAAEGWVRRLRDGRGRTRWDGYYMILRERLIACPRRDRQRKALAGRTMAQWDRQVAQRAIPTAAQRALLVDAWLRERSPGRARP